MKKYFLIPLTALTITAGCTQTELSPIDRATINSSNLAAQEAKDQAAKAAQDAAEARDAAAKAAAYAQAASNRADRIFREGQNK